MLGYLSVDIICSSKFTVRSRKTIRFSKNFVNLKVASLLQILQSVNLSYKRKNRFLARKAIICTLPPSLGLGQSGRTSVYSTGNPLDINCPGLETLREPYPWLSAKKDFVPEMNPEMQVQWRIQTLS